MYQKSLNIAVIGAGNRGGVYCDFIHRNHPDVNIKYLSDIKVERRELFRQKYGIPSENLYENANKMLYEMKDVDAVIVANLDREHYAYTIKAMERGCHILLEKPMSNNPRECDSLAKEAEKTGVVFMVCHVLRYTPFFSTLKRLLEEGAIGDLISIQYAENVSYTHMTHSYVRGNFRNSDLESPMILGKSCHDIDIMMWLADSPCKKVSSFGSLSHFKEKNAPAGATKRCTDGCPAEPTCPFSAIKYYLGHETGWPVSMISEDLSYEGRLKALKEGPYGRCVYYCDNNVVDHQVVNLLFENDVTATFSMNGFNKIDTRTIKVVGTLGEISGSLYENTLTFKSFDSNITQTYSLPVLNGVHGGGDSVMLDEFIESVKNPKASKVLTGPRISADSHLVTFAAEEARITGTVVNMDEYIQHSI